ADLQKQFDDLEGVGDVEVLSQSSTPGSQTIDITLSASDPEELEDATSKVTDRLDGVSGTQSVTSDIEAVQPVIEVKVDHEKAAEENLTEASIGQYVQRAMHGQQIGEVVIDDVSHSVLLFDRTADTVEKLRELKIPGKPEETTPATGGAGAAGGAGDAGAAGGADGAGDAGGGGDATGGGSAGDAGGAGGAAGAGDAGAAGDPGAMAGAPAVTSEPRFIELDDVADVEGGKSARTTRHKDSPPSTTGSVP